MDEFPKPKVSYSELTLQEMVSVAILRNNIKFVAHKGSGARTLYYFDGRIYRNDEDKVRWLLACEESHMYRDFFTPPEGSHIPAVCAVGEMFKESPLGLTRHEQLMDVTNPGSSIRSITISVQKQMNMLKIAKSIAPEMDLHSRSTAGLLCLNDCVIKITKDGIEKLDHSPDFFFTSYIDINYNQNLTREYIVALNNCERYFSDWMCGDRESIRLLKQVFGAVIRTSGCGKIFVFSNEVGGNGKSTALNCIKAMVGIEGVSAVSFQAAAKDSHQIAALVGKYANIVDDMSADFVGDISALKTCATGGILQINAKHQHPYAAQVSATTIVSCNRMPRIGDNTGGIRDRLVNLPFNARLRYSANEIPDTEFDAMMSTREYRRALLEISIQGLIDTLKNGYAAPESSEDATKTYLNENRGETDTVWAFIIDKEETVVESLDESELLEPTCFGDVYWVDMSTRTAYNQYKTWAEETNRRPLSDKAFWKEFWKHKPTLEKKKQRRNGENTPCIVKKNLEGG